MLIHGYICKELTVPMLEWKNYKKKGDLELVCQVSLRRDAVPPV